MHFHFLYRTISGRTLKLLMAATVITIMAPGVALAYGIAITKLPPEPLQRGRAISFDEINKPTVLSGAEKVPIFNGLIPSLALTAISERTMLIWSTYPASVRGRAFGGRGGDPTRVFGSEGGWG